MKKALLAAVILFGLMLVCFPASAEMPPSCSYWDANGDHNWTQTEVVLPSCEVEGYYLLKCQTCGWTKKEVTGGGEGHDWVLVEEVAVSCMQDGYQKYVCDECGETRKTDYPKWEHQYVQTSIQDSTCLSEGRIDYNCQWCNAYKFDVIPKIPHKLVTIDPGNPSCVGVGLKREQCTMCGLEQHTEIPAQGHNWEFEYHHDTDCLEGEYDCYLCKQCGSRDWRYQGTGPDLTKHNWHFELKIDTTCKDEGYEQWMCYNCGAREKRSIQPPDKNKHQLVYSKTIPADCTNGERKVFLCSICGYEYMDTVGQALSHHYVVTETKQATCMQDGAAKYQCSICGQTKSEKISAAGGHSYGEWKVDQQATENSAGIKTGTCKHCGDKKTEKFYPDGTLYRGCESGGKVTSLQSMLIDLNYLNDRADGVFGKNTESAVRNYQMAAGLRADGIAWPETIGCVQADWDLLMAELDATPTPTPEPTPVQTATPTPAPVQTSEPTLIPTTEPTPEQAAHTGSCFSWTMEGEANYVYCLEHAELGAQCDAMLKDLEGEALIEALKESRGLWENELKRLNDAWASAVPAEDAEAALEEIDRTKTRFMMQEMLWKQQNAKDEVSVLEKTNNMFKERCMEVCAKIFYLDVEPVCSENGYVSVKPVDGWYQGQSMAEGSITLNNESIGSSADTWITITDNQQLSGIDTAKPIAKFNYPNGEFTEIVIGGNSFQYIADETRDMFALLAETSTGKVLKIDGRNCMLERALPLLQTLIIR